MVGPRKRASFGMAYDIPADKTILLGGLWINGQYADLWEWSNAKWFQLGRPYDHSSLDHHAMIYDHQKDQIVLFCGKNYRYEPQQKTLSIDNGELKLLAIKGPYPRHSIGFTYDSVSHSGFLYGGKEYRGDEQVALKDFWKWDGSRWIELNSGTR